MSDAATSRPVFNPVDTVFANGSTASRRDDVESPSLALGNALARFEFEPGRGKEGTKVLMVEWEDDETTKSVEGDWEISWEAKRTVLPAREQAEGSVNRLYFLLGAGVPIPTAVELQKSSVQWRANPLPAIFSPELGATARQAGMKGVLHTIWAKKRLQVLQKEIEVEGNENAEGIGFQMAVAEKEWIESQFGVAARTTNTTISIPSTGAATSMSLNSPTSPRSPGGGRLMEKLKGLRIGTSENALSPTSRREAETHNPLSPEGSDVAVSSFGSFAALKGMPDMSTLAAKPAQSASPAPLLSQPRKMAPQRPPDSFAAQQRQAAGMGSLNALAAAGGGTNSFENVGFSTSKTGPTPADDDDKEDDLFALPMSPRSPEMTKSPFSFAKQDTMKYLQDEKA